MKIDQIIHDIMRLKNNLAAFAGFLAFIPGIFHPFQNQHVGATAQATAYGDAFNFVSRVFAGDGKNATVAYLDQPGGFVVSGSGEFTIADASNNIIRHIDSSGEMGTLAGTGSYGYKDGAAKSAEFANPDDLTVGSDGNTYIADTNNNVIRRLASTTVSTILTGLSKPKGIVADGTTLYISDSGNGRILKYVVSSGTMTVLKTGLNQPGKLIKDGNYLYFANTGDKTLRRLDVTNGSLTTIASGFVTISSMVKDGSYLYVADGDGFSDYIRKVTISDGTKVTIKSDPTMEMLNSPSDILLYNNQLYVLNRGSSSIWRFEKDGTDELKIAGKRAWMDDNGTGNTGLIGRPKGLALSPSGSTLYVTANNKVFRVYRPTKGVYGFVGNIADNYNQDDTLTYYGSTGRFSDPQGIVVTPDGTKLYVADRNNNRIREINISSKKVGYLTGAGEINSRGTNNGYQEGVRCPNEFDTGVAGCAYFNRPMGLAITSDGNYLYVADSSNNLIRRVTLNGTNRGETKLIAGGLSSGFVNGIGSAARFNAPTGIAISPKGTYLYVADRGNHAIRQIRLSDKKVTTVAGTGVSGYRDAAYGDALFSLPEWITYGADGNLYVSEVGGQRIRLLDQTLKVTKLVSGSGLPGYQNGARTVARFQNPRGLAMVGTALYVADNLNDQVRRIDITGTAPFNDPAPTITGVQPPKIVKSQYGDTVSVLVNGSNFVYGAKAWFGPYQATKVYVNSSTSLTVVLPISQMPEGYYEVKVQNLDTQSAKRSRAFVVAWPDGSAPVTDYLAP